MDRLIRHRWIARGAWRSGSAFAVVPAAFLICPAVAAATQGHGGREGLYVHQLSHVFFCISMGILIYWLRTRNLTREPGWRYIGIGAMLFCLWSADAFIVHLLEEQTAIIDVQRIDNWRIRLEAVDGWGWVRPFYYLAKLDHLFCVPALIFFYMGLRRLMSDAAVSGETAS